MDNVQKHNSCISIPFPQTFRSLLITDKFERTDSCANKIINTRYEAEVNKIFLGYQPWQLVKN
jgi:hypothetical protein